MRRPNCSCFSALQRAEIAEIILGFIIFNLPTICFSALQRAEIAEIKLMFLRVILLREVSVLFNEPKLLKCFVVYAQPNP